VLMRSFYCTNNNPRPEQHPDPQWRSRLDEIQAEHRSMSMTGDTGPRNGFRVNHLLSNKMKGKAFSLPTVRTLRAQEVFSTGSTS
jgi:centromere protein I